MNKQEQRMIERAVRVEPPPGLLRQLLSIPGRSPRAATGWRDSGWRLVAAPVAIAAVAAVTFVLMRGPQAPEPDSEIRMTQEDQEEAVRDFAIAMAYLQKTTEIAGRHAGTEISNGMLDALTLSRETLSDTISSNGG